MRLLLCQRQFSRTAPVLGPGLEAGRWAVLSHCDPRCKTSAGSAQAQVLTQRVPGMHMCITVTKLAAAWN